MKLVTRAQLGWPASAAPSQSSAKGVKVHYEGTAVSTKLLTDHDACLDEWKNIRRSHLANTAENYSDVAYNYAACPHGYLLEGRGLRRRTGANGNQALNQAHYAILGLVGSSGLTDPPDLMLSAIRDGIDLMRKNGAGAEIKGHRDGYATACPGGPLYAWVQKGAPRPATAPANPPKENPAMPLSKDDVSAIWKTDGILAAPSTAAKGNTHWTADSYVRDIHARLRAVQGTLDATNATIRTMAEALAARDAAVDVDALIARIETALRGVAVRLETES
ncbi:peptidoglycan recognition protein family protein [Streptomyces sp. f150]|uniref:peptidoglycan recognition protein family protein n=1 Tax=Streptomyces sp. f150 TaxID=1827699 RepID=UPI00211D6DBE|nr:peptidoglycan recognition family protein [Streptomyces sp. f150]